MAGSKNFSIIHLLTSILVMATGQMLEDCPATLDSCFCQRKYTIFDHIYCEDLGSLGTIPPFNLSTSASNRSYTEVTFRYNTTIETVQEYAFRGLRIASLRLSGLGINTIHEYAFVGQEEHLRELYLDDNNLEYLATATLVNLKELEYVSLENNKLKGSIAYPLGIIYVSVFNNHLGLVEKDAFKGMQNLIAIYIGSNGISLLPEGVFSGLQKLLELELNDNLLTGISGEQLSTTLERLDLSNNRLITLEQGLFSLLSRLRYLDLSFNGLQYFPTGLFHQQVALRYLDLSHNRLQLIGKDAFQGLRKLRELRLQNNHLHTLGDNVIHPLQQLGHLDVSNNLLVKVPTSNMSHDWLLTLLLSGNRITRIGSSDLGAFPFVGTLDLTNNSISYVQSGAFAKMIYLNTLKLSKNELNRITAGMFANMSFLELLYIEDNEVRVIERDSFKDNRAMWYLGLDGNHIQSLPSGVFDQCKTMVSLSLARNNLHDLERDVLKNLKMLRALNLDSNSFETLENNALRHLSKLETLTMKNNALSMVRINTFRNLKSLLTLDLSHNLLRTFSTKVLEDSEKLEMLKLGYNRIQAPHPDTYFHLSKLTGLVHIDLSGNRIESVVLHGLDKRKALVELRLEENPYDCGSCDMLWVLGVWEGTLHSMERMQCSTPISRSSQVVPCFLLTTCWAGSKDFIALRNECNRLRLSASTTSVMSPSTSSTFTSGLTSTSTVSTVTELNLQSIPTMGSVVNTVPIAVSAIMYTDNAHTISPTSTTFPSSSPVSPSDAMSASTSLPTVTPGIPTIPSTKSTSATSQHSGSASSASPTGTILSSTTKQVTEDMFSEIPDETTANPFQNERNKETLSMDTGVIDIRGGGVVNSLDPLLLPATTSLSTVPPDSSSIVTHGTDMERADRGDKTGHQSLEQTSTEPPITSSFVTNISNPVSPSQVPGATTQPLLGSSTMATYTSQKVESTTHKHKTPSPLLTILVSGAPVTKQKPDATSTTSTLVGRGQSEGEGTGIHKEPAVSTTRSININDNRTGKMVTGGSVQTTGDNAQTTPTGTDNGRLETDLKQNQSTFPSSTHVTSDPKTTTDSQHQTDEDFIDSDSNISSSFAYHSNTSTRYPQEEVVSTGADLDPTVNTMMGAGRSSGTLRTTRSPGHPSEQVTPSWQEKHSTDSEDTRIPVTSSLGPSVTRPDHPSGSKSPINSHRGSTSNSKHSGEPSETSGSKGATPDSSIPTTSNPGAAIPNNALIDLPSSIATSASGFLSLTSTLATASVSSSNKPSIVRSETPTNTPSTISSEKSPKTPSTMSSEPSTKTPSTMSRKTSTKAPSTMGRETSTKPPSTMGRETSTKPPSTMSTETSTKPPSTMSRKTSTQILTDISNETLRKGPSTLRSAPPTETSLANASDTSPKSPSIKTIEPSTKTMSISSEKSIITPTPTLNNATSTETPSISNESSLNRKYSTNSETSTKQMPVINSQISTKRPSIVISERSTRVQGAEHVAISSTTTKSGIIFQDLTTLSQMTSSEAPTTVTQILSTGASSSEDMYKPVLASKSSESGQLFSTEARIEGTAQSHTATSSDLAVFFRRVEQTTSTAAADISASAPPVPTRHQLEQDYRVPRFRVIQRSASSSTSSTTPFGEQERRLPETGRLWFIEVTAGSTTKVPSGETQQQDAPTPPRVPPPIRGPSAAGFRVLREPVFAPREAKRKRRSLKRGLKID